MRFFTARSLTLAALVPALVLFIVVGCAKQSEGERCGDSSFAIGAGASDDCGDGLTCTLSSKLVNDQGAHRCCYTDGRVTDSRCEPSGSDSTPSVGGSDAGGSGGTGGIAGSSVAGGSSEAGSNDATTGGTGG